MSGLFSQFDTQVYYGMKFLSFFILFSWASLAMLENNMFKYGSRQYMFWKYISDSIDSAIMAIISNKYGTSSALLFLSIFSTIISFNCPSLAPYIFPVTSHFATTFSIGMMIWISQIIIGSIRKTLENLEKFAPSNTNPSFAWFMVLIETTSELIRPMTLCLRLSINITAGHLILALVSNASILGTTMIFILEILVSLIQAYIFMTLLILYLSDNI